ncbi:MAG: type VI secretion system baseplate subunit TssK [Planctomycetaceae bacterium]|nr:type VI secretion system baseplate subunit TssK [Planctomycetaceae bacterium]
MYPKPVYWFSGQFLEPQHFQEADRWHAAERAALAAAVQPFPWGVGRLEVDTARLAQGVVSVAKAALVFPDGSRAVVDPDSGSGNAVCAQYDFSVIWKDRRTPLTIHAALGRFQPRYNVAGALLPDEVINPTGPDQSIAGEGREWEQPPRAARYLARLHANPVPDRYAMPHPSLMDSGAQVGTLFFRVLLASPAELEELGDVATVPVVRLICRDDIVQLDDTFAPPLVRNDADEGYMKALRLLDEKLSALAERLRNQTAAGGDRGLYAHLMQRSIARVQSDLATLLAWEMSHPWDVHRLLHGALAELSCDMGRVATPIDYRHREPRRWLADMTAAFDDLLHDFLPTVAFSLTPRWEDGQLVFSLPDAVLADDLSPCIEVRTGENIEQVLREGRIVAGEVSDVRNAVRLALPVLALARRGTPGGLPVDADLHYLAIKHDSSAYNRALAARRFGIAYYPEPVREPEALTADVRLLFLRER